MRYEDMEFLNYQHILGCIQNELDAPSRADIAKHLGLSRTTVSTITNNLIDWKVLTEGKGISVSRGRPGNPIALASNGWVALGAAFSVSSWRFVACDLQGKILDTHTVAVEHVTPTLLVSTLIEGLKEMQHRYEGRLLPAVGLGVPGVVDTRNGDILFAHDLAWHDTFHVRSVVEAATGLKVYMRNRYCVEGIAEYKYANPEREQNYVFIGLGSGISCAIFVDGNLMEGDTFCAGRIAHIQVVENGPQCNCGKHGCLLTVANETALLDLVRQRKSSFGLESNLSQVPDEELTVAMVGAAADAGDAFARSCLDAILIHFNKVISILVDTLNPRKIVIGGPIGYSSTYLIQQVDRALRIYPGYPPVVNLTVAQGQLGERGAALGAASMVLEHVLDLLYPMYIGK